MTTVTLPFKVPTLMLAALRFFRPRVFAAICGALAVVAAVAIAPVGVAMVNERDRVRALEQRVCGDEVAQFKARNPRLAANVVTHPWDACQTLKSLTLDSPRRR